MVDNCPLSKELRKCFLGQRRQRHKPCAQQLEPLINLSAENISKRNTNDVRQFATDACALITNFKHCGSDAMRLIGCCRMTCLLPCSTRRLQWYHPCLSHCQFMLTPGSAPWTGGNCPQWHPSMSLCWFCWCSTWLFAASSDSNLGDVYIVRFLKVCSLLWFKS